MRIADVGPCSVLHLKMFRYDPEELPLAAMREGVLNALLDELFSSGDIRMDREILGVRDEVRAAVDIHQFAAQIRGLAHSSLNHGGRTKQAVVLGLNDIKSLKLTISLAVSIIFYAEGHGRTLTVSMKLIEAEHNATVEVRAC